ncbi:MAG: hypothetical protein US74_C0033G0004 [Parcubacteria group bacterium GW2011_GWA2_38_13]|nr:MAG: hypothetical protein US74_C0033G0004 [Parcubacteria group bacterium GW2011_GWA2_38_13]
MDIKNSYNQKPKWLHIVMGVGIGVLIIYLVILARNGWKEYDYIGKSSEFPHTIEITGIGKALAIPDIATVSLGLETQNSTVAQAQADNTKKMNQLYEELKKNEILKEDIATTQYNVYPKYEWRNDSQIFKGYVVAQNVTVKIRNFDKIPNVLELIGTLGLNQVNSLNFTMDNPEILQQSARVKAIKNAREKAEALAAEAGVKLGRVISFSENNDILNPEIYRNYAMKEASADSASLPQIEPGSQEISVQINLSYEIL